MRIVVSDNYVGMPWCTRPGLVLTRCQRHQTDIDSITAHCVMFITLRPRRNEQHFTDDIVKRFFFNENAWISIEISLKFVPKCPIKIATRFWDVVIGPIYMCLTVYEFFLFCLIFVYSSQYSFLFWIMYLLQHFGYLPIIKYKFC